MTEVISIIQFLISISGLLMKSISLLLIWVGLGFVFTGENDADIMHNSVSINLNVLEEQRKLNESKEVNKTKIFYSGSACMYPEHNQLDPDNPDCREESAYPANPDSEYGWEKLFSERLYFAYNRNYGIPVRVTRYHNIFGPEGTWEGGRESALAICRKVAYLPEQGGGLSRCGEMSKLVPSCSLTNALKRLDASWTPSSLDL